MDGLVGLVGSPLAEALYHKRCFCSSFCLLSSYSFSSVGGLELASRTFGFAFLDLAPACPGYRVAGSACSGQSSSPWILGGAAPPWGGSARFSRRSIPQNQGGSCSSRPIRASKSRSELQAISAEAVQQRLHVQSFRGPPCRPLQLWRLLLE